MLRTKMIANTKADHRRREEFVALAQKRNSFAAQVYPDMDTARILVIAGLTALVGFTVPQMITLAVLQPVEPEISSAVINVIMIPGASIGVIMLLIALGFLLKKRWARRQIEKWDVEHDWQGWAS